MNNIPRTLWERLKFVGPGVVVVGSVVGSGEVVLTSLLGAAAGFVFLWWILISIWSKSIVQAEISRYIIVKKETFMEAFSKVPGLSTNIQGKKTSWLVWFLFLGVIPSVFGMGGIAGAAAQAGNLLIPEISTEIWVIICCLLTWMNLYCGSYVTLERILLAMVVFFSFVTLIIAISMQATPYEVTWENIQTGFSFDFPMMYIGLAIAVYGYTGINSGEIIAYTYWCLEKGYAKEAGNDKNSIKGWIKIMQTDVWATLFLITIGTLPFFFLGAGVLNELNLYPPPNGDIILTLVNMFTEVLGNWAMWLFIIGAFFVLFSTSLSGSAAYTRTIPDYLISTGLVREQTKETRRKLLRATAFFIPFFTCIVYFLLPNPITLLIIAGVWAAISLPIVNAGTIFLIKQLDKDLQPKPSTVLFLWLTLIFQIVLALFIVYSETVGF